MTDIIKTPHDPLDPAGEKQSLFKGYTLEELRYQRALVTLKKDFSQSKLLRNVDLIRNSHPLSPAHTASVPGKVGFVATKLLSGLNYLDYAMLGFSIFSSVRKVYSFFRRKK